MFPGSGLGVEHESIPDLHGWTGWFVANRLLPKESLLWISHNNLLYHSGVIRPVRGQRHGSRANGSFPKDAGRLSEKSPGAHPPPHQPSPGGSASATPPQGGSDALGARASRPHPVPLDGAELQCDAAGSHPVGENPIGQAEGEPWRCSRLIQVGEMVEAVPGLVRAGRPRSQEAFIP